MWCTIGIALERNSGHGDDRTLRKSLFQIVILRLAFSEAEPPAIIVDHDGDVIRIIERCRAAVECGVIEFPLRRGDLPNEFGEIAPVFVVLDAAAFGGEIELVQSFDLGLWR